MYKPGANTVLLNESGSALTLGLKHADGSTVVLHPRKGRNFVDVEEECDERSVQSLKRRFEEWTSAGIISWHKKGSSPVWQSRNKFRLPEDGESRSAPPNVYDEQINALNKKQKVEDEKTKQQSTGQDRKTEADVPRVVSMTHVDNQTRTASAAQGEVDAAQVGDRTTPAADPFENWETEQIVEHAVKFDVLLKKGNHFTFNGESIGNGFKKAADKLKSDADLLANIKVRLPAPS